PSRIDGQIKRQEPLPDYAVPRDRRLQTYRAAVRKEPFRDELPHRALLFQLELQCLWACLISITGDEADSRSVSHRPALEAEFKAAVLHVVHRPERCRIPAGNLADRFPETMLHDRV